MTLGERVCLFIETHCQVPEGELVGQKIRLLPFQRDFILAIYDNPAGSKRAILSCARKNGKTALIACLVLAHLVGPVAMQNAQIVSGALTRKQAALVFNAARKMCLLNPAMRPRVHITESLKRLRGLPMGTEYEALSADAGRAMGLSPVVAILDEVGQITAESSPFVDAIVTAQGAYKNPLLLTISTSARDDQALLSTWIDDAKRTRDPHTILREFTAPKDCELDDRAAWHAANPALGVFRSLADMEDKAARAKRLPSEEASFRNLFLNQRIALESLFIAPTTWRESAGQPSLEVFQKQRCAIGLDLSARGDLTAAVLAARESDDDPAAPVHLMPFVFAPLEGLGDRSRRDRAPYEQWARDGFLIPVPGSVIEYEFVSGWLQRHLADLEIEPSIVAFDRWRIDQFKRAAIDSSFGGMADWRPVPQTFAGMSPRLEAFEALLLEKRIRHGGHPLLTMAAAQAIAKRDPAGNRQLTKEKGRLRIDPLVAAVMAAFEVSDNRQPAFDAGVFIA